MSQRRRDDERAMRNAEIDLRRFEAENKELHQQYNQLLRVTLLLRTENEQLRQQRDALLKALSPFADFACRIDENETSQGYSDACPLCLKPDAFPEKEIVNLGHCRQARAAIKFAEGK
jgi:DNA repair exonuclease SbcCD ATPase subunit